jgi:hypothetical protein
MGLPMQERQPGDVNQRSASILDRMAARFVALLVLLAVGAALAWIHRDDLLPRSQATLAVDDPVALCVAERAADIDKMRQDGVIDADRATLFKSRAEALCQTQFGQGSGPSGLPQ